MSSTRKSCWIAFFAVFALFLHPLTNISGQGLDPRTSYRKETLEIYLDRADLQTDVDEWRRYAAMGRDAVLAEWEQSALLIMEGVEVDALRASIESAIGEELGQRFRDWIVRQFVEVNVISGLDGIRQAIQVQNSTLLFEKNEDGQIRYLSDGSPALKSLEGLDRDAASWKSAIAESIESSLASWRSGFEGAFPELLSQVSGPDRDALAAARDSYADLYSEIYRRELAALAFQEEQRFVALRSYDQYSSRKRSEEQTAGVVVDRLIAETQKATEEGIRKLEASLLAGTGAGAQESDVDPDEWQASFQRILDEGLATWDKAGQRLLAERIEWERQAGDDYLNGEKAWAAAYERLSNEQEAWETKLRALLREGREAWSQKEAELEAAIERASSELEAAFLDRTSAKAEEVESLVDVYAQSASMVATARDSAAYWLDKLGMDLPEGASGNQILLSWAQGKLRQYRGSMLQSLQDGGYPSGISQSSAISRRFSMRCPAG